MEQQFSVAPHELRRGVGAVYPAIQLYNDSHVGGGLHLATSAGLKQKVLNASNQPDSVNAVFFCCAVSPRSSFHRAVEQTNTRPWEPLNIRWCRPSMKYR